MSVDTPTDEGRSGAGSGCIAEIDIAPGGLFFADTMAAYDGFSGILVPYQMTNGSVHSLLRTNTVEYGVLENRVRADSTVRSLSHLRTIHGEHLYDIELLFAPNCPLRRLSTEDLQMLSAEGVADRWRVLIWLSSVELLEICRQAAEEEGIGWEVHRSYRPGSRAPMSELTPVQRETVETALEMGYFEIPRAVSMQELAAELGVSPNAVSERLRRAQRKFFAASVMASSDSPSPSRPHSESCHDSDTPR